MNRKQFAMACVVLFLSIGGRGVALASGSETSVCDSVTTLVSSDTTITSTATSADSAVFDEDWAVIEVAIANIYDDPAPFRIPGYIADDSLDKVIFRYGTNALICAFRQNFAVAKYQCDNENPFVGGGNILAGNLLEQGTDGATNMIYKGYDIDAISVDNGTAIVDITLKADHYENCNTITDNPVFEGTCTQKVRLKMEFGYKGDKRICELDDIQILGTNGDNAGIPKNVWLRRLLENNALLHPVFHP